ncbi:lysophospholipid acyltransferase family protein [Streptomyces sp. bgisy022]|uniref:lysophospholipid acyltransferase family protein n=1 Tax=Streptomyces sp. bgisy022 TaxID=3413769 RepID=UPI003D7263EE
MSAWLPAAPCTPRACVRGTVPGAGPVRAVLRLVGVLVLVAAGVALLPCGGRVPARLVRRWCRWIVRAAGVRVRLRGAAAPVGGLLLVAPHVSWLDVPLLAAVRPARLVAKAEIRHWPLAGPLAARGGVLFLDRDRLRTLPDTVGRITEVLRGGGAVGVFPEGSTWCGPERGSFRRAVFQAALDAGCPVQPVAIRYAGPRGTTVTAAAFVGDDTLVRSVWRVVSARGLVAEVEVPAPLTSGPVTDRRALARAAQRAVGDPADRRRPGGPG